jgi:predicted nucleotidyltransferase component of viral defense system
MNFDPAIMKMIESYPDDMPKIDKVREILQQTALLGLSRHRFFEHAVFFGGTALRILYGLDRYSEDLDFSLITPNTRFDFAPFLDGMHQELKGMGFVLDIEVREKNEESGIWSAFLKANTLSLLLSIHGRGEMGKGIHPEQKLQIKLEIEIDSPQVHLPFESKLVINPIPFYVASYALGDLFAGKMHAILCRGWQKRVKGRDWYDLIWYVQRQVPLHIGHLKARMIQTGHITQDEKFEREELVEALHKKIEQIDFEMAKADIALFIPDKTRLNLWSKPFFHDLISYLIV